MPMILFFMKGALIFWIWSSITELGFVASKHALLRFRLLCVKQGFFKGLFRFFFRFTKLKKSMYHLINLWWVLFRKKLIFLNQMITMVTFARYFVKNLKKKTLIRKYISKLIQFLIKLNISSSEFKLKVLQMWNSDGMARKSGKQAQFFGQWTIYEQTSN